MTDPKSRFSRGSGVTSRKLSPPGVPGTSYRARAYDPWVDGYGGPERRYRKPGLLYRLATFSAGSVGCLFWLLTAFLYVAIPVGIVVALAALIYRLLRLYGVI